jgi:hypothetical protein
MKKATATSHGRYFLLEADSAPGKVEPFVSWAGAVGMEWGNYSTNDSQTLLDTIPRLSDAGLYGKTPIVGG